MWWLLLACRPGADLVVVSAEEVGVVPRSEAVQGRDGGPSALAFGRSVWTYGDTVLNFAGEDGTTWHTNSWDHADPATWPEGVETPVDSVGAPRFFVELTAEERAWNEVHGPEECEQEPCHVSWALWPSAPLYDPDADRAWVLHGLYNEAFESGIGVGTWAGLDEPVVRQPELLFPETETEWIVAPVVDDGWLYTFGCPLEGFARPCHLARVPLGEVDQRGAWTFWDGREWASEAAEAAELFGGAPIMAVSYEPLLERWLLVYSEPFSNAIEARTAPEITGPWSRPTVLFEVEGDAPYDAQHHAELADDGVHWVTFSRPTEGWFGAEHALWRVELAP